MLMTTARPWSNWTGPLARLYAHQHTTDDEATELMHWLVGYLPWLCMILGNHDKWGPLAAEVCKQKGVTYASHGAMLRVKAGESELLIDARHTHRGHSMYNPSHAQLKRNYRGSKADVIVGAHTHTSAYTLLRNGITGKVAHALRIGSYKECDEYADAGNFDADSLGPSAMLVIDPSASDLGFVTVFHNLEHGKVFLGTLRAA